MSKNVEQWNTKVLAISVFLYYSRRVVYIGKGEQKMEYKKSLFGRTVIDSSDSDEIGEDEKIELEYYETHYLADKHGRKYGIEVVKKKRRNEKFNIETKIVNNLSSKEKEVDKLLEILMLNKVTPISVDDVISDISVLE